MRTLKNWIALVIVLVIPFSGILAQDIIEPNDLIKIIRKPTTIIVSARKTADYSKVHITGAVNLTYQELDDENVMLLPPDEIAKILGSKGISESKSIVLYDEGSQKYAGRLYWVLKYMGAPNVKILNGGMPAWRAARKPVTGSKTVVKPTTFTPSLKTAYLATMADVAKAINNSNSILVDARSEAEYMGTATTTLRPGHIPSAVNIEYVNVLNDGKLKSNEEIAAIFAKNGVTKDKNVIVYCETSVRAGILFHVLTSALHYPNVKVYDGAYRMWQQTSSNKVVQ